jgi:hypothetical protein
MSLRDLREEVETEFCLIDETLGGIAEILERTRTSPPQRSDTTAGAAYLAQCYNGVENIFKRIVKHCGASMPQGPFWHVALLASFADGAQRGDGLPALVDSGLFPELTALRKLRHTVVHGYAVRFEWEAVSAMMTDAPHIIERFRANVVTFLDSLAESSE